MNSYSRFCYIVACPRVETRSSPSTSCRCIATRFTSSSRWPTATGTDTPSCSTSKSARQARVSRVAVKVFAASLHLYPASLRDEYGREMTRLLADRLRHATDGVEAALLWLQAIGGVLLEAPKLAVHERAALRHR